MLAGLVQVLQPKLVSEIGTAEGLSALSMLKYPPPEGKIVTFDIVPWSKYPHKCLSMHDFYGGRLQQIVAGLSQPEVFERHKKLLGEGDIIFIDAAKAGVLERKFIADFENITFWRHPIFMFDDIRLWNMLQIWRLLRWPKLDITSFGHWCGTGICELDQ